MVYQFDSILKRVYKELETSQLTHSENISYLALHVWESIMFPNYPFVN